MGMCASGYIFQANLDYMLCDIDGFKTYIYGVLFLRKKSFYKHIEQLRIIFRRFRAAGLKVNDPKCSFELKEITYLGYEITQESIKPDPKKAQGIIYLGRTNTMTEVQAFVGIVYYYRDM